ncbi:MAG: SemiSWEET transporter [Bacteroidetes bacterium]|nr:SemiSWEET transporter [Bacteroidota bacterium]
MDFTTILGFAAGICTTFAFLPQVIKALKTKDTKSISLGMYIVATIGVAMWLIYGIIISDLPVILANAVTLVLILIVLSLKIKHG